ncbi:MAG: hypothetical protein R6W85_11100 [Gillisia sp.]
MPIPKKSINVLIKEDKIRPKPAFLSRKLLKGTTRVEKNTAKVNGIKKVAP